MSSFDLWLLSLLRMILFTLIVLMFCFNKVVILKAVKQMAIFLTVILTVMFCFSVAKLLTSFEFYEDGTPVYGSKFTDTTPVPCENTLTAILLPTIVSSPSTPLPRHPWLWAGVTWSVVCVLFYGFFSLLGNREQHTSEEMPLLEGR